MLRAQFRIELPEHVWVAEVSQSFPQATFRLLSGFRSGDSALELGEIISDRPETVLEVMRTHPSITDQELLEADDDRILVKYETTDTELYDFAEISSVPIEFPVEVRRGWYEFDLTGTADGLDRLQEVLDAAPMDYELLSLVRTTEADGLLTDRQRETLELAVRQGNYEVPRERTVADLADELGVDKSTVSTVIRRGEARVIKWFLTGAEQPGTG